MQIYYESFYHIKYDTEFWRQKSINYPYGESVFFTGAMPFVNNIVKIFGPSAAPSGIGLINLMMLFSPVIGALFLYAIFRHLRLPWLYGALTATAIAFLSPQMMTMYEQHYSLQWVFLLPMMFYLLLRFYDYPSLKKSFLIAALVFLGASTHLYFLAFFAGIGGVYWAILFITRDRGFGRFSFVLKHICIQFLLPVIVLQILVMMSDHVTDRTVAPYGYLVYHSNKTGIFFPFGKPYEQLVRSFLTKLGPSFEPDTVEMEGAAYVGLAGIFGLVSIVVIQFVRLFREKVKLVFSVKESWKSIWQIFRRKIILLLSVTENKVLNIFFWTSLAMLWFSFGHPFIDGHQDWLPYLGPLRQFRAIGRFTWAFFYSINIITVYRLYRVVKQKKILSYVVMSAITIFLFYDMYYNINGYQDLFNNRIAELEDGQNNLPQDVWLQKFKTSDYQAILPLPYFHMGSENLCKVTTDSQIVRCSYIVSLKTGLPMMGVNSARVSLGQTRKMLPIAEEPFNPIPVLKDLPDDRPLLLVVREQTLDRNERRILSLATPLATSTDYELFSIRPSTLAGIVAHEYDSVKVSLDTGKKFPAGEYLSSDSITPFVFMSYDDLSGKPYHGKASYSGNITEFNPLFDSSFPTPGNYIVSFWMNNICEDVYGRTQMEIFANDTTSKVQPYYLFTNVALRLAVIDGNWGLVEFPVTIPVANAHLKITLWNYEMKKKDKIEVDDLLIRPANADLYKVNGNAIFKNNRTYFPQK